jgi:hypothetical protein
MARPAIDGTVLEHVQPQVETARLEVKQVPWACIGKHHGQVKKHIVPVSTRA